jgi:hypothetical protein
MIDRELQVKGCTVSGTGGRLSGAGYIILMAGYFFVNFIFFSSQVFGQGEKDKTGEGEIEKVEIEIVKNRAVSVPQAVRNFEKVPPRSAEPIKPEITYRFRNLSFNVPDYNPVLRPLKLKAEAISKIYGNYLSVGFGNYASPYAEAYLTSKRNKNKSYGVKFFHRSFMNGPVDGPNSASGHTELRLFGKTMSNSAALGGFANFENTAAYFYGYRPGTMVDRSSIRQDYNIASAGGEVENAKLSNFKYNFKAGYSFLSDHYSASENEVNVNFSSQYEIDDKRKFIINSDYFLMDRKDALVPAKARQLFKVKPAYQFTPIDQLELTAGFNTVVENDTIGKQNGLHFYPNLAASYPLSPSIQTYAGLTGDVDKVSLHSLSRENVWLNSNVNLFNTNRTLEFLTGLKGKVISKVSFGAGLSFAFLKNLYYYQSDTGKNQSKFNVFYDNGSTRRTNLFAEVGYSNEAFQLMVRGDYFGYSSTIADQIANRYSLTGKTFGSGALQRPTYRVAINSSYNIYSKLLLSVDFIAQGGIRALDLEKKSLTTLTPALDLNLKINYFVSKQFAIFLNFNNMLSSNYQLYLNYPVRGFQAMGGASWSF